MKRRTRNPPDFLTKWSHRKEEAIQGDDMSDDAKPYSMAELANVESDPMTMRVVKQRLRATVEALERAEAARDEALHERDGWRSAANAVDVGTLRKERDEARAEVEGLEDAVEALTKERDEARFDRKTEEHIAAEAEAKWYEVKAHNAALREALEKAEAEKDDVIEEAHRRIEKAEADNREALQRLAQAETGQSRAEAARDEAREEQRESDASGLERFILFREIDRTDSEWDRLRGAAATVVRATPLDATPLADRIRVLEGELDRETLLATNLAEERDEAWKALDAIAAIPEVDAAEGGEEDAVLNALATLKAEKAALRKAVMAYLDVGDCVDWPARVLTLRQAMRDALATDAGRTWLREFARRCVEATVRAVPETHRPNSLTVTSLVEEVCK